MHPVTSAAGERDHVQEGAALRSGSDGLMAIDPNAPIRAAVLATTLTFEPRPADPFELRVPAIRRVMPRITPPLDLTVIPFRYRVTADGIEAIRPKCHHARRRSAARS
jgi:hypothetical protein